ncbi:uncharacterized protein LOC127798133 isoform X2 [Diospyros lotus]|uniref:uncharacterized protein LOC127798133 isoform X2 n=1 Tax=Diospyros lotus TaxID=55363 RepID=UPI0022535C73|nr:uncharacterized protein LOC127798133 isoform X2 [Diospyros lotus]
MSLCVASRSLSPSFSLYRLFVKRTSQPAMEKHPQDAMKNEAREGLSKESHDLKPSKTISDRLITHLLNLYGSRAMASDFEIYAPDATFEDQLMCARGIKQIKSAFYSLSKVFSESAIVEYSIKENAISPSKQEILIDNKQHYKFLGRGIDIVSLITLYVENGKVIRHEDWWDKKPLWNRQTVRFPLFGRVMEVTRRGTMLATHAMMGFGKDP